MKITLGHRVLAYIRIFWCVLFLFLGIAKIKIDELTGRHTEEKGFKMRRWYIRVIRFILGIKLTVEGEVPDGPGLYVSNHRSLADPVLILDHLYAYVISMVAVKNYPWLGYGARMTGTIFVNRADKDSKNAVKETIGDILRDGKRVLIFPEGKVNVKPFTAKFKKGSIEKAIELGVPIIPVTVEYKDVRDYWRKGSLLQQFILQYGKWRSHCYVKFNKPHISQDLNSALRRLQITIDGDIARYQKIDDFSPR